MKKLFFFFVLLLIVQIAKADIVISDAWLKPTIAGKTVTSAYLKISTDKPVKLIGGSAKLASSVEIHEMKMDGDVMRMRQIEELPILPHSPTELKPGGLHLMLVGLKKPIEENSMVLIRLTFKAEDGQKKNISVKAKAKFSEAEPTPIDHSKH